MKKCQILRRTMRTLLQDLAQKSLKGLGTKACTNWEDRSANSLSYQVSNHSIFFLYAGCLSLQSSHLMRAILHDFKGYSFALELVADVSSADIFCQNIYGVICSTLRTLLFLFNKFQPRISFPRSRHPAFHFHFGEHRKCCIVIYGHSLFWAYFVLLLQCDKLPSPHFLQALFESVNLSVPIQYRAKRQPRYFPNGMQYGTETILDFVFRGRGNWKLRWISQFDLASTCTYCVANLKRPNLK